MHHGVSIFHTKTISTAMGLDYVYNRIICFLSCPIALKFQHYLLPSDRNGPGLNHTAGLLAAREGKIANVGVGNQSATDSVTAPYYEIKPARW